MNYYEILGIAFNSDQKVIKEAYRNLAKIHHPDVGGDSDKFKKINEAYEVLSDLNKKSVYDSKNSYRPNPMNRNSKWEYDTNVDDFFSQFWGNSSKKYENNDTKYNNHDFADTQNWYNKRTNNYNDLDIKINHTCTLKDLLSNSTGNFTYTKKKYFFIEKEVVCSVCNGKGKINSRGKDFTCALCRGNGKVKNGKEDGFREELVTTHLNIVNFRKQIMSRYSQTIMADGLGHEDSNGKVGKIIVNLNYIPLKNFSISGDDLVYKCKLNWWELLDNSMWSMEYVDGSRIDVPSEHILSSIGRQIKILGKGFIDTNGFSRGDLTIIFDISLDFSKLLYNKKICDEIVNLYKN